MSSGDLFNWLQALGSTLDSGLNDETEATLRGMLNGAQIELWRALPALESESEEDGYYSDTLRGVAETLADGLRAYPADTVEKVCACIAEGRTSDLWKVLP